MAVGGQDQVLMVAKVVVGMMGMACTVEADSEAAATVDALVYMVAVMVDGATAVAGLATYWPTA